MANRKELLIAAKNARDSGDLAAAEKLLSAANAIPEDFSIKQTFSNIPSSAAQFVDDVTYPIRHPIDTATSLKDLAVGAYEKFTPGIQPEEANVDAVGKFIMDRYGSVDAFKQTVMNDPVGVLADAASILTLGGAIPGKAGMVAGKVGRAMEPVNITKKAVGVPLQKIIPKGAPANMYESAAKFSTTLPPDQRRAMAMTALDEKILPTSKGVAQGYGMIDVLGKQIDDLIQKATDNGVMVPKQALFKNLTDVRNKLGGTKLYAGRDLKKIDKIIKDFDIELKSQGKNYLTPNEIQAFKQDIYANTNYNARTLRGTRAGETTEKALARSAKSILEKEAPGVKELNQRQGRLLELVGSPNNPGPLARSAARIENRDIGGIGLPIKALTANQIAPGGVGAIAGTSLGLLDTPLIKSRLALGLNNFLLNDLINKPLATGIHSGLFQTGRYSNE